MYRLVVTVEPPRGPAVRGIDNRLARPFASYDTEREALAALEELVAELRDRCAYCDAPMNVIIRGHHHSENGRDVTGTAAERAARGAYGPEYQGTDADMLDLLGEAVQS